MSATPPPTPITSSPSRVDIDIPKLHLATPSSSEKIGDIKLSGAVHTSSCDKGLASNASESTLKAKGQNRDNGGLCVRVFVRPRPLQEQDKLQPSLFALDVEHGKVLVEDGSEKDYQYDGVLSPDCSQAEVYEQVVKPLVQAVLTGYNATVLAYGQTGSGKTYTMGTGGLLLHDQDKEGVLQRVLADLLPKTDPLIKSSTPRSLKVSRRSTRLSNILSETGSNMSPLSDRTNATGINANLTKCPENNKPSEAGKENLASDVSGSRGEDKKREVCLTFLEVYNEKVYDLLTPTRMLLNTKPDSAGGVQAASCSELSVVTLCQAALLLQGAVQRRSVAATALNAHSSRSHALVGIKVKQGSACSVLWLVDLAGSECVGRLNQASVSSSSRVFGEGVAINKGLLALGKVLTARAANSLHVPYRDSILTHLLRESVSGNSRTAMIACASLSAAHATHTHTTLRYAEQARNVRTKPVQQPPSTIKRLKVNRRHEDPTATPGVRKKRMHSIQSGPFKTPLTGPQSTAGKFLHKGGRSGLHQPPTRPLVATGGKRGSVVLGHRLDAVYHNTTVSTPGHTPSPRQHKRPLNSTFTGHSRSQADGGSYGKTALPSPLQFPSLKQPLFEEEESVQPTPCSFSSLDASTDRCPKSKRLVSSPLQGISKLPTGAAQPDMTSLISSLANQLEPSVLSKIEDRLVDKMMARITSSRRESPSCSSPRRSSRTTKRELPNCLGSTGPPPPQQATIISPSESLSTPGNQSSSGTPEQVRLLLDSVLATPSRRGRTNRLTKVLQNLIGTTVLDRTVLQTTATECRRSTRLMSSHAPSATASVPAKDLIVTEGTGAFLVPTMPPPSLMPKKKKKGPPAAAATSDTIVTCPETPSSSGDVGGLPLTSTTFKNNYVKSRHPLVLPVPDLSFAQGKVCRVSLANMSVIENVSPDIFASCDRASVNPAPNIIHTGQSPNIIHTGQAAGGASPDLVQASAAAQRKSVYLLKRSNPDTPVENSRRKSRRLTPGQGNILTDITNTVTTDEMKSGNARDGGGITGVLLGNKMVGRANKMAASVPDTSRMNLGTTIMTQTSFSSPSNNQTTIIHNNTATSRRRRGAGGGGNRQEDELKMPALRMTSPQQQEQDVGRRRSTRRCALDATILNRTLLSSGGPLGAKPRRRLSTTSRGRGAGKAVDTSKVLDYTALAVSPSVVRQHSDEVLSLLNSGCPRQLQQLSLVGPKTAMVIVVHRKFCGEFSSLRGLEKVAGLPKSFFTRFCKANMLLL